MIPDFTKEGQEEEEEEETERLYLPKTEVTTQRTPTHHNTEQSAHPYTKPQVPPNTLATSPIADRAPSGTYPARSLTAPHAALGAAKDVRVVGIAALLHITSPHSAMSFESFSK